MSQTPKENTIGFQRRFLVLILLILLVSLIIFASPFMVDLFIAGILVAAVYPLHKRILKVFYFSRSLGAVVSMLLITIVVLLPFSFFAAFIVQEAGSAYNVISQKITEISAQGTAENPYPILNALPFSQDVGHFFETLPVSTNDLLKTFSDSLGQLSTYLLGQTTAIIKRLSFFLLHVIVFLMSLFYFLRDGDRLVVYLKGMLPMSNQYRDELFLKLSQLSYGIIYGIFGAAILQGFLVGVAFAVAGFNNATFWGALAALFAPVPFIGPMAVWIPALIILLIGGKWLAAVLFLLWCMFVVGTADNFIKPYLIGASSALNPMALLIVILGGAFVFGLKGLIFGPFILTLTLSFLHIYQLEYKAALDGKEKNELENDEKKETKPTKGKWLAKFIAKD